MAHNHDREGLYRHLGPAIVNALKEWNEKKGEEECAMCIGAALAAHAAECLYAYANAFEDHRKRPTACVMQGMGAGIDLFGDVFEEDYPEEYARMIMNSIPTKGQA